MARSLGRGSGRPGHGALGRARHSQSGHLDLEHCRNDWDLFGGDGPKFIYKSSTGTSGTNLAGPFGAGTLRGANTFSGSTSVTSGTLDLSNQYALQQSTLAMSGGIAVFDSSVSGNAFTVGGLSGAGGLALSNSAGTAVALSVGNNNANTWHRARIAEYSEKKILYKNIGLWYDAGCGSASREAT